MCAAVDKTQTEEGASQVEKTGKLFVVTEDECGPKNKCHVSVVLLTGEYLGWRAQSSR